MTENCVLRLDHRIERDKRITTHVALTSRALGVSKFIYSGDKDDNLEKSVNDVVSNWGGNFRIEYITKIKKLIQSWNGIVIHLTMYGEKHENTIETLSQYNDENYLIIVGGSKVPRYIYSLADLNTAIGWQPHSEVAALGIFLYLINHSSILYREFQNAKVKIQPGNSKSRRSSKFIDQ